MPLIGGALSYSSRHYVATGYSAGHRTSVDPLGIGDIAAIYDFYTLCNDILKEEDKHWDAKATLKLANALRGGGADADSAFEFDHFCTLVGEKIIEHLPKFKHTHRKRHREIQNFLKTELSKFFDIV